MTLTDPGYDKIYSTKLKWPTITVVPIQLESISTFTPVGSWCVDTLEVCATSWWWLTLVIVWWGEIIVCYFKQHVFVIICAVFMTCTGNPQFSHAWILCCFFQKSNNWCHKQKSSYRKIVWAAKREKFMHPKNSSFTVILKNKLSYFVLSLDLKPIIQHTMLFISTLIRYMDGRGPTMVLNWHTQFQDLVKIVNKIIYAKGAKGNICWSAVLCFCNIEFWG